MMVLRQDMLLYHVLLLLLMLRLVLLVVLKVVIDHRGGLTIERVGKIHKQGGRGSGMVP